MVFNSLGLVKYGSNVGSGRYESPLTFYENAMITILVIIYYVFNLVSEINIIALFYSKIGNLLM